MSLNPNSINNFRTLIPRPETALAHFKTSNLQIPPDFNVNNLSQESLKTLKEQIKYIYPKKTIPLKDIPTNSMVANTIVVRDAKKVEQYPKFDNFRQAYRYAKNKCVQALHVESPHEYAVLLDNKGKIITEKALGETGGYVNTSNIKNSGNCMFIHGHTESSGTTTPVSLADYYNMVQDQIGRVIAYDKKGNYNSLKLSKDFDKKNIDMKEVTKKYFKEVLEDTDLILFDKFQEALKSKNSELLKKLEDEVANIELKPESATKIHKFWKRNAKEFGVEYKTNFEHLKD